MDIKISNDEVSDNTHNNMPILTVDSAITVHKKEGQSTYPRTENRTMDLFDRRESNHTRNKVINSKRVVGNKAFLQTKYQNSPAINCDTILKISPINKHKIQNQFKSNEENQDEETKIRKFEPYGIKINYQNDDDKFVGFFDYLKKENIDKKEVFGDIEKEFTFRKAKEEELLNEDNAMKPYQEEMGNYNRIPINENTTMTVQFQKNLTPKKERLEQDDKNLHGFYNQQVTTPHGNIVTGNINFSLPLFSKYKPNAIGQVKKSSKSMTLHKIIIDVETIIPLPAIGRNNKIKSKPTKRKKKPEDKLSKTSDDISDSMESTKPIKEKSIEETNLENEKLVKGKEVEETNLENKNLVKGKEVEETNLTKFTDSDDYQPTKLVTGDDVPNISPEVSNNDENKLNLKENEKIIKKSTEELLKSGARISDVTIKMKQSKCRIPVGDDTLKNLTDQLQLVQKENELLLLKINRDHSDKLSRKLQNLENSTLSSRKSKTTNKRKISGKKSDKENLESISTSKNSVCYLMACFLGTKKEDTKN